MLQFFIVLSDSPPAVGEDAVLVGGSAQVSSSLEFIKNIYGETNFSAPPSPLSRLKNRSPKHIPYD
jgi:hypothetical protein